MISVLAVTWALAAGVPGDLVFEKWFVERNVTVEIARTSPIPWLRGTGEIPANASGVESVLLDFRGYRELMTPAVLKADVLESKGEMTARLHMVWHYPFPLRNRDAVVRYQGERLPDGTFRLRWQDEAHPGDPAEGVRIAHVAGETAVVSLAPDRCRLTYTYLGDLGGNFPRSAEEKAWRAEPVGYFRALRRRLHLPDP